MSAGESPAQPARRPARETPLTALRIAALLTEDGLSHRAATPPGISGRPSLDDLLERSFERVLDRDERGLRRELERAVLLYDPLLFLDDVLDLLREARHHVHELPARVGDAVGEDRLPFAKTPVRGGSLPARRRGESTEG